MSRFQSTVIDENFRELQGGKEIKPPLIPSNTEKIYSSPGVYNLRGFYTDLNLRLAKQKKFPKESEYDQSVNDDRFTFQALTSSGLPF